MKTIVKTCNTYEVDIALTRYYARQRISANSEEEAINIAKLNTDQGFVMVSNSIPAGVLVEKIC